jgi:hypothetical protein
VTSLADAAGWDEKAEDYNEGADSSVIDLCYSPPFSAILALAKMGIQGQNSGLTYFDLTGRLFQLGRLAQLGWQAYP